MSRIDPTTETVTTVRDSGAPLIAYGDDAVWLAAGVDCEKLERLESRTGRVLDRACVDHVGRAVGFGAFAAAAGALWGGPFWDTTRFTFDPNTGNVLGAVPVPGHPVGVAAGEDALWAVGNDNTLLRVDPESARVVKRLRLGLDITLAGVDRAATGTVGRRRRRVDSGRVTTDGRSGSGYAAHS